MADDWYDIKFLESASNVKALILRSTGRMPSAQISREISSCLQQGRLYFEAASAAPIQIKPLLIYYGVVAFSQGVVVARSGKSLSTLARRHGLHDITPLDARIEDLTLKIDTAGTFQEFNDAIAPLGRIWYFENSMPRWLEKAFDPSSPLAAQQMTLKEILARAPGLSEKYCHTFGTAAKSVPLMLNFAAPHTGSCSLRIDDPELFESRASLVKMLSRLRTEYPFLAKWHFVEALHAWGYSVVNFTNAQVLAEDTVEDDLLDAQNGAYANRRLFMRSEPPGYTPASEILPPLSGGYTISSSVRAMRPVGGVRLNEHSLQFLGSFLLSSLVRYRPLAWQAAISRSVSPEAPADDRALALIEEFLGGILRDFPAMVVRIIDYQRTR